MQLLWKYLWPEMKLHGRKLIIVLLLGVVISGLKAAVPALIGRLPGTWEAKEYTRSYQVPMLIAGLWIAGAVCRYFHLFGMLYTADLIGVNLRRQLMNKYLSLNLGFFQN